MKKKKLLILISIALGLAVLAGGACVYVAVKKPFRTGDLTGTAQLHSIVDRPVPSLPVRDSGNFVILQFTDTHLTGTKGKDAKTLAAMEQLLLSHAPDLVVIAGDLTGSFGKKMFADKRGALDAAAALFERHGQYWAYVPGEDDGEALGTSADVAAWLGLTYPHCILSNEAELTGAVQYVIPLLDGEGVAVHALVFLDSLARDPETNDLTYDCMKKDQADWLRESLRALGGVKASVFFHMNTPAFTQAKQGEPYKEDYAMIDFPDSRLIRGNEIIDKAMAAAGNVGLVSIGHLHPAGNRCAFWEGTYYHIARASGYRAASKPGAALITIHTYDGSPRRMYDFAEIVF